MEIKSNTLLNQTSPNINMSAEDTNDLKITLGKVLDISGCKKDDVIDGLIHGHPSGSFQLIKHGKLVGCLVEQAMLKDKNNPYDNESKNFPPGLSLLLNKVSNGENDGKQVVLYKYDTNEEQITDFTPDADDTFYELVSQKQLTERLRNYKIGEKWEELI